MAAGRAFPSRPGAHAHGRRGRPTLAWFCTLLASAGDARDVLHETNLILWKRAGDYDLARPFGPWAIRFAHFQALAWRKRQSRDRLVFGDETLDLLAAEFDGGHGAEGEQRALEECLGKLPEKQHALVSRRYQNEETVNEIATGEGKPPNVVAAFFYRARKTLADCIRATLATGERSA